METASELLELCCAHLLQTSEHAQGTSGGGPIGGGCAPEDLDEGDLQRGDFAVHEDAREVQLHLEAHVHVGAVDGGRPPQREAPVGDLVQPERCALVSFLYFMLSSKPLACREGRAQSASTTEDSSMPGDRSIHQGPDPLTRRL